MERKRRTIWDNLKGKRWKIENGIGKRYENEERPFFIIYLFIYSLIHLFIY